MMVLPWVDAWVEIAHPEQDWRLERLNWLQEVCP